jgi:glycosyltransferase involved in cell wall biosynthesis
LGGEKISMKKVLFVAAHRPDRSPSQRFRFEQYISFLESQGWQCSFSYLISVEDDQFFYKPGNGFKKLGVLLRSIKKRLADIAEAKKSDIVFIQREAFMLGSTYFEKQFAKSGAKVIFDFDDAIWFMDVSDANKKFKFLKNPGKTADIIKVSDLVFAGNQYLADYAKLNNKNVVIVPTTIDTEEYKRMSLPQKDDSVCIGWSGSITTIKHFEYAIPVLTKIKEKYGNKVSIKVIGDGNFRNESLGVVGIPWKHADEVKELSGIDIGIMPLPDDEWAKGKCGLKGLQYMALEIPTLMSPVGVNSEIIQDGVNGYLANEVDEWVEKISKLVESEELRKQLGQKARETVLNHYSIESEKKNYLKYFEELTK